MEHLDLIQDLQERNLISQITNKEILTKLLSSKSNNLYCGFDPTADSLHIGHLLLLICLKRFQLAGHRPIILIGTATALIGDPSFKLMQRKSNTLDIINEWSKKIKLQIELVLDFKCTNNNVILLNNYHWLHSIDILSFLNKIGRYISINSMINRRSIKQKLRNNSISFTEFSYALLQGYDFIYLNQKYNVTLQIGGSDQWGNIITGINLVHSTCKNIVYGLTIPLITKSNGIKFGKTEDQIVWLDANKTSPYAFYQFWINIDDNNVYRYLKFFTFINVKKINNLEENNNKENIFYAKRILAEEMTSIVHGKQGLLAAQRITTSLFEKKSLHSLTENDFIQLNTDGIPKIILKNNIDLQQALVLSELAKSRGQARIMIAANAIKINNKKQSFVKYIFCDNDKIFNRYTLLCRGKKHYCLINWEN